MKNTKLLFFGDFSFNTKPNNIFSRDLLDEISKHDITSCNFEGPACDENWDKSNKVGSYLCQHKDTINYLSKNKINLLNIANNHIYDFKERGIKNTLSLIKNNHIYKTGADIIGKEIYKPTIIEINGMKIGFLSFCEAEFGVSKFGNTGAGFAWINDPHTDNIISKVKGVVDFLVIQVHAGIEEIQIPLPEWRERYKGLVDAGGDLIIGHHPHVPQGWEPYKNRYIFYSLGNFVFENKNREIDSNGYAVSITINQKKHTKLTTRFLTNIDGKIHFIPDTNNHMKQLCDSLSNDKYEEKINKIAIDLWENRYQQYYINALGGKTIIIKRLIKNFIPPIKLNNINSLLLLHNIRIESHRWLVERALSIMSRYEDSHN